MTIATGVDKYAPNVEKSCEGVSWSHPAVNKPGLGPATSYQYSIAGGEKLPYEPGQVVFQGWDSAGQVSLFVTYESGFSHQFGQSRFFNDVVCVAPKPDAEVRETVTEAEPNCALHSVEVTTTTESAGYYLGDDGEWHLGDWFPVESVVTVRDATDAECPVVDEPEQPEEELPVDETPAVDQTTEQQPVDETHEFVTPPHIEKMMNTPNTLTAIPEPAELAVLPDKPVELAQTGPDALGAVFLAGALVLTGVATLVAKKFARG